MNTSQAQVINLAPLLLRSYADGVVIYNIASAETHLLNQLGGDVLQAIESGCTQRSDLSRLELPGSENESQEWVLEYIAEFERLGILTWSEASIDL
ncbi:MAG: hypothetical protein V7709_16675 [Halioglobus sp.]